MTLLNYWHYITFAFIFLIFLAGIMSAFKQEDTKLKITTIIVVTVISILLAVFSVVVVDKYTKKVALFKLKNKRLLSTEQIIYTGIVENEGNYAIGKVTFEIKLVNRGHATGSVKGVTFYKSSGFFDFFSGDGFNIRSKPQSITKEFVVAKNLKPGTAKSFRVYFRYPPYFSNTAQFTRVWGH
jgi:hypothetical protein